MRSSLLAGILLFVTMAFTFSETSQYPLDFFRSPVDRTIRLSGTFGELRPNHLHAGIDIKAYRGKVGQRIYAAAEGYVSRVKVQSGGYGNVLYLAHPNGYTTVYAHLGKFPAAVAEYVEAEQYRRESFEVDLYPPKGKFSFASGDPIGTLGMSGRSFGPHLHFEIRDSRTEKPINPLLFGIPVVDNIAPRLHQLKIYHLNDRHETLRTQSFPLSKSTNRYRVAGDTLLVGAWRVGLALKAFDHLDGASNWNGVYRMELYEDDGLIYDFTMETFAFNESRYINAHLDYAEQVQHRSYYNRLFSLPGNRLSIYREKVDDGVIQLAQGRAKKITMKVYDVAGNSSQTEFWVRRGPVKETVTTPYNYLLPYDEENLIKTEDLRLYLPKGTLYENLYFRYHSSKEKSEGLYSAVHHLHQAQVPIHRYFDLAIQPHDLPDSLRSKAYIAFCGKDGSIQNCGGEWENGRLKTRVRSLGNYCILVDEKAPRIQATAFQRNMKGFSRMSFKVTDDIPTARNVEEFTFRATVDGQWVLFKHDGKKDLLTHYFDGRIGPGQHELRLVVRDSRGNEKIYQRNFAR
ncbi:MAG: M23 family metallopeptidase [Bacteroidota bacterium]